MSDLRLYDYSFQHPDPAALRRVGAAGAMRYLTRSGPPKRITANEVTQLHAASLSIGLVYEDAAARATEGHAAGGQDAATAAKQALDLGYPQTCPIFYAVDTDVPPEQVFAYFRGISDWRPWHPVGVYGSRAVVDGVLAAGLAVYAWQTVAWSYGRVSPRAHLLQRVQATHPVPGCDENVVLHAFPLWAPTPAQPRPQPAAPAPQPAATQEDSEMRFITADGVAVYITNGACETTHVTDMPELIDLEHAGLASRPVKRVSQTTLDTLLARSR